MMNIEQITARLAKLPDQALQQYAAMHKNDPYIIALAVSESNRRKQMRQAAQGAQGEMEQPTVVDQDIAEMAPAPVAPQQMLPEDTGIAQLPVGEMEFAGGGIVAFADGGDVERYQSNGLVQPQQRPGESFEDFRRRAFQESLLAEQARRQREYEAAEAARQRVLAERGGSAIPPSPYGIQRGPLVPSGVTPVPVATPAAATSTAPQPVRTPDPMTAAQPTTSTYTRTGGDPGPGRRPEAPTTARAEVDAAGTTPARTGVPGMDVGRMVRDALTAAGQEKNPFATDLKEIGEAKVRAKEEEVKGLEAIQKQFADIYKGRKERLDTREGELGKMKDQQQGLALLQAGAAMMTTTGGIGKALGKGVQVGSEQYAAGLEKLQAAKDKIVEARDRLEEIEAQRNELSARELNRARNEVKQTGISAREDLVKSNMQMYGVNRETAMKMVDMQVRVGTTQMEIASRERVAATSAAAAARNPQLEVLRAITSDPKLLQTYQAMHGSKSSIMDEYTKFLKENPTLMGDEQKALAAFLRAKGVLGGMGASAPAAGQGGGTVLPRKD